MSPYARWFGCVMVAAVVALLIATVIAFFFDLGRMGWALVQWAGGGR